MCHVESIPKKAIFEQLVDLHVHAANFSNLLGSLKKALKRNNKKDSRTSKQLLCESPPGGRRIVDVHIDDIARAC